MPTEKETRRDKMIEMLMGKIPAKQGAQEQSRHAFEMLKEVVRDLSDIFSGKLKADAPVEFKDAGDFEFSLSLCDDTLSFTCHSNIFTFPENHVIFKSPYVKEDPNRALFGQIMIYNFMTESWKYNRLDDAGYLLARLFVNGEGHFYVEGVRPLYLLYPDIAENTIATAVMEDIVDQAVFTAVKYDLIVAPYSDVQQIPLRLKKIHQMVNHGAKLGFDIE
jgi:hypothetical protein